MARAKRRPNKFGAIKMESKDGVLRDSKAEARFVNALLLREKAGEISGLRTQVPYELIPSQYIDGKCVERAVKYIADAAYTENGVEVVADKKGLPTPDYIIKRKLMLFVHGIRVQEV